MASLATSVVDEYGTVDVSYSSQGYQSWSMNYRLWTPVYRTVSTTSARCQDRKYNADVYQLLWTYSHFAHGSGCKVLWSVRLCVCLCVFVCPQGYLRNHTRDLCQFFCALQCLWPWLGPPSASLRYVMYFRFCGRHHVFLYNGPYSSMNFATKDEFCLNLLIYRKVKHKSISYY